MFIVALLSLTGIASIILATISYLAGKKILNVYLAIFTVFIGLWAMGDALMLYGESVPLIKLGTVLFAVAPMVTAYYLLLFSYALPDGVPLDTIKKWLIALPMIALGGYLLIDIDWLLQEIRINHYDGRNTIAFAKDAFGLYSFYFNVYFVSSYYFLFKRYRHAAPHAKKKIKLVLIGVALSSSAAVTTNTVLPQYFDIYHLVWLGPPFTLFFSLMTAIAIVRHGFLDVRAIVARSFGYLLSLLFVVMALSVAAIVLPKHLFGDNASELSLQVVNILSALSVAIIFPPLTKLFNKLSNRIFYRDAYEANNVLSTLNTVFVSSLGLKELLTGYTHVVQQNLKLSFVTVVVGESKHVPRTVIGTNEADYDNKYLDSLGAEILKHPSKIIFTDNLKDGRLQTVLRKHSVSAVVRLSADATSKHEVFGYILLGEKLSGGVFNGSDKNFLEISGDGLLIAVENALRYEEIREFSHTLEKKVSSATSQLRTKNVKLHELDQAKDDFISMASHQLRTPLTTIKGYLSMLEEGDFGKLSTKQERIVSLTYTSAERMVYLIADLLNISRINTGKFVIERSSCNLAAMVRGEVEQLRRAAKAKDVRLTAHIPKQFPMVLLDETKTRQVIMNLIDNAIYYTPSGKTIDVHLTLHRDSFDFKVIDTGIGVPESEKEKLFTKFFRANNARSARPDGTGLGLYMAHKVITAQGGSMIFESSENKGSTFGFRFSLAAIAARK